MNEQEALRVLRKAVDKAGGQASFAAKIGVSRAYINDVYHGRRSLGPRVLKELGMVSVTQITYEEVSK